MNGRNNWQSALEVANESLKMFNISLEVTKEDNTYGLDIVYPDNVEHYACGYFEDELEMLIQDTYFLLESYEINSCYER